MNRQFYGFTLIELLLALALSSLICVSLFDCVASIEILHQRQLAIASLQEKSRFLTIFFREKIQVAGDWSCEPDRKMPQSIVMSRYTAEEALDKVGVTIKEKTDLLQLQECVRFDDQLQYLPVNFFVASTNRVNAQGKSIDALFIKIDHHLREELVTNLIDFRITVKNNPTKETGSDAVKIDYLLSSIDDAVKTKSPYWFHGKSVMPQDQALYQPGEIYVARRNALT